MDFEPLQRHKNLSEIVDKSIAKPIESKRKDQIKRIYQPPNLVKMDENEVVTLKPKGDYYEHKERLLRVFDNKKTSAPQRKSDNDAPKEEKSGKDANDKKLSLGDYNTQKPGRQSDQPKIDAGLTNSETQRDRSTIDNDESKAFCYNFHI